MDEVIVPLFAPAKPEPGALYHNKEVVHITGLSGDRLREYQRERIVHVRERVTHGSMHWNLCSRSDIAVFVVASELRDAMDAHYRVQQAAALGCYAWAEPEQEKQTWHPITHALYSAAGAIKGFWVLRIRFTRNDQNGQRRITAYCYDDTRPPRIKHDPRDPWLETSSTTLMLQPLLMPLARSFKEYGKREMRVEP